MRLGLAERLSHPLHDGITLALLGAAADLGIDCEVFGDPTREREFDAVLLMSDPGHYTWLTSQPQRSRRILWMGENLPSVRATAAQRLLRALPSPTFVDGVDATIGRFVGPASRRRIRLWRERAAAEREIGRNLDELKDSRGKVRAVFVTSPKRREGARLAGFNAPVVPIGYHEAMCGPIVSPDAGPRDIDVLLLGRDVTGRTRRARLLDELAGQSLRPLVVDRDVYGDERSALVTRARIVLELFRVPGNTPGVRFLIAASGGAALVAEQSTDSWAGGIDDCVIQAPTDRLADEVSALLADEARRQRLVETGQELLRSDLAMRTSLAQVLAVPGVASAV